MKAVVIYESMYGNTHQIANAIAEGLGTSGEVCVVAAADVDAQLAESADLVVVGGPTHAHGMSHASTRKGAADAAEKSGSELVLDASAENLGLREWFDGLHHALTNAAAFDTRFDMSAAITGRASKGIARKLRHHGATMIAEPESFFVKKDNHLEDGEEARAREWGIRLASILQGPAFRETARVAAS